MSTVEIGTQSTLWEKNSILKEKRNNSNKQYYMPFLFRSKRQFPFDKHQMPPVGLYQVPSIFDKLSMNNIPTQPEILKKQFIQKNQMCIFKSNQERFLKNKNNFSQPAFLKQYQLKNSELKKDIKAKYINKFQLDQTKKRQIIQLIKRSPSCPAIPDSKLKYGYTKSPAGNLQIIKKTATQIQKQKLKLRQYCSTLVGQQKYTRVKSTDGLAASTIIKNQHKVIQKLAHYAKINFSSLDQRNASQEKKILFKKPKVKLSHQINFSKPSNKHLGPGYYNVTLNTLKKQTKHQNFQFFSSSELRFTPLVKQQLLSPYDHFFDQKRRMEFRSSLSGKIYRKSFPGPIVYAKLQNPGPGYYQPQYSTIKKYQGNTKFGNSQRFKEQTQLKNQPDQFEFIQEVIQSQPASFKTKNFRKKQKIKSPHKQYLPVPEQHICGIMSQDSVEQEPFSHKNSKIQQRKQKPNAVFFDKRPRPNIQIKTYSQGISEQGSNRNQTKIWQNKGSFISKLPKRIFQLKQNTPGPEVYEKEKIKKKSFNIKHF